MSNVLVLVISLHHQSIFQKSIHMNLGVVAISVNFGISCSYLAQNLQLCSSLEVANKLVQSTHGSVRLLLERVEELEKIVKRGDSAVASLKVITISSVGDGRPSVGREHVK